MDYIANCGKIFLKKETLWILYRNKNTKNGNFDGLCNHIMGPTYHM